MEDLSRYLEKFKKIKDPLIEKQAILDIINRITKAKLTSKNIRIKDATLYISGNSYARMEAMMQKETILKEIAGVSSGKITEIR